ncbi:MAG: glycerophosphodiester phosphodiesterase family protein [Hyphomicrobiales bacterium]
MLKRPGALRSLDWLITRPVAHRGLHDAPAGIIENTCSAVEAAIAANYAIEVDLQRTGDGEAVVFHDYSLNRLTDKVGKLAEKTTAEIQQARFNACSDRIQTLGELLDQVNGRAVLVIELKAVWHNPGPLERRVGEVLSAYKGPAAVMSFDPRSVAAIRHHAPKLVRGITSERYRKGQGWNKALPLVRRLTLRHMAEYHDAEPQFVAYNVHDLPYGPSRKFKNQGLPVLTWTVKTPDDRMRATRYADQIIFEGFRP